jgi:DNA-binding beta-propeller fold protein YncE
MTAGSCAHRPVAPEVPLVWPGPPDEPKIQYLGAIRSGSDINATRSTSPEIIDALRKPYGVVVDSDGRIYVTDSGRVMFFDRTKRTSGSFGHAEGEGRLTEPIGIAVSRDGRVFVTDVVAGRVMVFSADGKPRGGVGRVGDFASPAGIVLDEADKKIYVVDSKKHRVNVYSLKDYSFLYSFGSRGTVGEGKFNFPTNAALDSKGNLYVVDTGNFKVQVFDKSSAYIRTIGTAGDLPGTLARPKGIAIDSEDNIYVVDAAFQNVQVFNGEGKLLIAFGKGGLGPGSFTLPAGMTIDSKDRIYVVDQWPGNVQLFQYLKEQPAEQTGTQKGGK